MPIAGCLLLPLLPFLIGSTPSSDTQRLRVDVLAVGAGSCSVIELPQDGVIMIDCGSSTLIDLTRKCIAPYLRYHGDRTIRRLYISHANYDHFSAASEVTPTYDVDEILVSPQFISHSTDNPPADSLLDLLHEIDRAPRLIWRNQRHAFPGGIEMQVLWPPVDARLDPNNSSLVLRLTFGERSVLFTGDIESAAQSELLKNPGELKSDVLIAPHHGSVEETTAEFIRAVDPTVIISSNDRTLSMKQKRLPEAAGGRTLYRTHTSGAVTVYINGKGELQVNPYIAADQP
jgi:competence protein ComEC